MSLSLPIFHNIIISEIWVGHIAIDVGHTAAYVDVHQMLLLSSFPSVLEILRGTSTSLTSRVQRCCRSFASDAQHAPPASNSIRYCVPLPRRRCSSARIGTCSSHRWDAQGSRSTPSASAGAPPASARAPPAPPPWAAAAPLRALPSTASLTQEESGGRGSGCILLCILSSISLCSALSRCRGRCSCSCSDSIAWWRSAKMAPFARRLTSHRTRCAARRRLLSDRGVARSHRRSRRRLRFVGAAAGAAAAAARVVEEAAGAVGAVYVRAGRADEGGSPLWMLAPSPSFAMWTGP